MLSGVWLPSFFLGSLVRRVVALLVLGGGVAQSRVYAEKCGDEECVILHFGCVAVHGGEVYCW